MHQPFAAGCTISVWLYRAGTSPGVDRRPSHRGSAGHAGTDPSIAPIACYARAAMRLRFAKYEGLGNDFLVVDGPPVSPELAASLCDRHRGIGADGVLSVDGLSMRVINSDGSRPEMCGNGLRCVALHLTRREVVPEGTRFEVATDAGLHACRVDGIGDLGRTAAGHPRSRTVVAFGRPPHRGRTIRGRWRDPPRDRGFPRQPSRGFLRRRRRVPRAAWTSHRVRPAVPPGGSMSASLKQKPTAPLLSMCLNGEPAGLRRAAPAPAPPRSPPSKPDGESVTNPS